MLPLSNAHTHTTFCDGKNTVEEMAQAAIARGHRTAPYPNPAILRHIHDLGGKIIINSDAHAAEHIDCAFPQAVALAKACGFKTVLRLRSFGFEEIPLD